MTEDESAHLQKALEENSGDAKKGRNSGGCGGALCACLTPEAPDFDYGDGQGVLEATITS